MSDGWHGLPEALGGLTVVFMDNPGILFRKNSHGQTRRLVRPCHPDIIISVACVFISTAFLEDSDKRWHPELRGDGIRS